MSLLCSRVRLIVPSLAVAMAGCTSIEPQGDKSPLERAVMPPDSCVLDIFFVRFPFGDDEANGPLWTEIDEQRLPCELRRRLAQNGFRAGVVGGCMPCALVRMLELNGKPAPSGESMEVGLEELETRPNVVRRHLQLRDGRPREIVASGVRPQRDVLLSTPDGVCGRTYADAQAVLSTEAESQPDGRVRLALTPELQYGDPVSRFVGRQYAFHIETSRSRRVFDDLRISAALMAEEMLVIGGLPNRPSSLGHHFFTQKTAGQEEQKLLVIRLSQTQHDELFSPSDDREPAVFFDSPAATSVPREESAPGRPGTGTRTGSQSDAAAGDCPENRPEAP